MTKKAIEMASLKKVTKVCGRYIQILPKVIKADELSNEGMVLYLDRNTRTAKGHTLSRHFIEKDKLPDRKNIKLK